MQPVPASCSRPLDSSLSSVLAIVGRLLGRGVDARYLMAPGLAILAAGGYWMSRLNLDISPWQIVWPRVVFIIGLSAIFAPLNVAAFMQHSAGTSWRGGWIIGAAAK